MHNIHCCDNVNLVQNDKFAKLRRLIEFLSEKILQWPPRRKHTVLMNLWYHTLDDMLRNNSLEANQLGGVQIMDWKHQK